MKKKILLIEDEPSIADNILYALESEGFEVVWAETGEKGEEKIRTQPIDCIVLDVGLPDWNGFELCKAIRRNHETPILFLTARSEEIDRVIGLEIGADDYVTKPFSPRELVARVKAILRRRKPSFSPAQFSSSLQASNLFQIDESRYQILFQGKPLKLSRYEYRILKILIHRPGQVFTRDKLMELAWDDPDSSLDRTVDAHIKNIRAELRKIDASEEWIETHRSLGYSLKETG